MVLTSRMRLVPATAEIARAEIEDRPTFAALLGATVPANWPPEMLADALPFFLLQLETPPDRSGWLAWYGLAHSADAPLPVLVASGGFMGPPKDGAVEVGYSVLPQFQRQGFATEMVAGLITWAFGQPGVRQIVAEARTDNTPSVRLLRRLGFSEVGAGGEPESRRFALGTSGSLSGAETWATSRRSPHACPVCPDTRAARPSHR